MGTITRSLTGLFIWAVSFGAVLLAVGQIYQAYQIAESAPSTTKAPKERVISVNVGTFAEETVTPVIISFGTLFSGRSLELRTSVAGPLVELATEFRDGGLIKSDQVLFRIDPAKLETGLALAESDLDEAEANLAEAQAAMALANLEVDAATTQLDLRKQAAERQQDLRARGVATEADVEAAVLAKSSAEQALIGRQQVFAQNEARVAQAAIAMDRRRIALVEARRALSETTVTAPFSGVMSDVTAVLGRLVSVNEKLGVLIDPANMEVAFRVTNTQFARLLNDEGNLRKVNVTLILEHGNTRTQVSAKIERAGAEVGDGQIGRLIYARLVEANATTLRPGDFLTVNIPERPLDDVARIPATAATADGRILVLADGDRLEEIQAKILRQQGDDLIVSDVPFGSRYVVIRSPQIGPGIQVQPIIPLSAEEAAAAAELAQPDEPVTIELDAKRRSAIIAFVEGNESMEAASKERVLEQLRQPEVSLELIERFEGKMEQ